MAQSATAGLKNDRSEQAGRAGSDLKFAVIVAAGSGTRAGGEIPKQFQNVGGLPMLCHSVKAFRKQDPETVVILVLSRQGMELWSHLTESLPSECEFSTDRNILIVEGGSERTDSVSNALGAIAKIIGTRNGGCRVLVAVHDAARPMVSDLLIRNGWKYAAEKGAVVPAVPLADSIRRRENVLEKGNDSSVAVDRSEYVAVQTPQVFDGILLMEAYARRSAEMKYTDDASVVESVHPISLFPGDPENIKVTRPHDFVVAEALLARHAAISADKK